MSGDFTELSVRVPGSTSNLGAGFDCFGLALQLYLTVEARLGADKTAPYRVVTHGEGAEQLPQNGENLICRAMQFIADRKSVRLPPLELVVHNDLPLGRGIGSSAAAIVAGMVLVRAFGKLEITDEKLLQYASELEGHADNVAACFHGGLTVSCVKTSGELLVQRQAWPSQLEVVLVSPDAQLNTEKARLVLGETVKREDAVFNLQRTALFLSALNSSNYELLWDAMQDRLHQRERQSLVPGLTEALAIQQQAGLLGVALSGSGPSVVAITTERSQEIGDEIAARFRQAGIEATVRVLKVDENGCVLSTLAPR